MTFRLALARLFVGNGFGWVGRPTVLRLSAFAIMLSLVLCGDQNLRAGTRTWTGTAADDLWSLGGNWLGGVAPVDGDSVVFYLNTPRRPDGQGGLRPLAGYLHLS